MSDFDRLLSLADALAKGVAAARAGDVVNAPPGDAPEKPWSPEDLEKLLAALRRIDQTGPELVAPHDATTVQSPGRWAHLAIFTAIGSGAFGTIYRAHEPRLGVDVALELLSPSEPAESVQRFLDAGRRLVRLRHPNVVRCYGVDEWAGCAGMWTELVKGQTLDRLVFTSGRLLAEDAVDVGRSLCHAAAVIRQAGLPHVNITAHNVAREASGRVLLMAPISRTSGDRTEADVVRDIATLIAFLAMTPDELRTGERAIASYLADLIDRSTSSEPGQTRATLDGLESALARTMIRGADEAEGVGIRRVWRAVTSWFSTARKQAQ